MTMNSALTESASQQRLPSALELGALRVHRAQLARPEKWRHLLRRWIPDALYILYKCLRDFRVGHGAYPNILRPQSFSEKIQHRKLFDRRRIFVQFADKLLVRDYVRNRIGAECLTELYHVAEDPNDIPLDKLPDRFVMKPTHGCGWISIVRDKSSVTAAELSALASNWLSQNYFWRSAEWIYKDLKPRVLFEELLDDGHGGVPYDIKFFVFDGRVAFITVDVDRFGDHRRNSYDRDWNVLHFGFQRASTDRKVPRPERLDEMIRYAEMLSAGFDFLRIDLYSIGERIVFGEITTTPASGLEPFWPGGVDSEIGRLWTINLNGPKPSRRLRR
jgi:hypothetical protein